MDPKSLELVYMGFALPVLFAVTLVFEGVYKIHRHEEGFFTFLLGILFLVSLAVLFFNLTSK